MSEAGYTLSETLAAMAVLSLSVGSLSLGLQVLGPSQHAAGSLAARVQTARTMQVRLERLLDRGAPFSAEDAARFNGDTTAFQFSCGAPQLCAVGIENAATSSRLLIFDGRASHASLPLPSAAPARFQYRGAQALSDSWPPVGGAEHALRSISLVQTSATGGVALLDARVWAEQAEQCALDPISQACR